MLLKRNKKLKPTGSHCDLDAVWCSIVQYNAINACKYQVLNAKGFYLLYYVCMHLDDFGIQL